MSGIFNANYRRVSNKKNEDSGKSDGSGGGDRGVFRKYTPRWWFALFLFLLLLLFSFFLLYQDVTLEQTSLHKTHFLSSSLLSEPLSSSLLNWKKQHNHRSSEAAVTALPSHSMSPSLAAKLDQMHHRPKALTTTTTTNVSTTTITATKTQIIVRKGTSSGTHSSKKHAEEFLVKYKKKRITATTFRIPHYPRFQHCCGMTQTR